MLDLTKIIRDALLAESNITDLVDERIYMPFSPEANISVDFPHITLETTDGATDSLTNDIFPELTVHIWTKGSGRVTAGEEIAKQVILAIDRKSYFIDSETCIFQVWKSAGFGIYEDDTQTYHHVLTFNVVMQGYHN